VPFPCARTITARDATSKSVARETSSDFAPLAIGSEVRSWPLSSVAVMQQFGSDRSNSGHAVDMVATRMTPSRHGLAELLKAYVPKVRLQRTYLVGRGDCSDIAVGTHKHPITGCQSVGVA
jgi:hypothetical protein